MRGGTCRCPMCGSKNAGHSRNDYIRCGIRIDESGPKYWGKRSMRQRRRAIEKRNLRKELISLD